MGNAGGIQMVFTGNYGVHSGPGVKDLVAIANSELADQLGMEIDHSVALAAAIPSPFDLHLRDTIANDDSGWAAVLRTIESLETRPTPLWPRPKKLVSP